jgi:hypothetical protein
MPGTAAPASIAPADSSTPRRLASTIASPLLI